MAPGEFLQLFHPHSQDLQRFLLRRLKCADTAADLFQETWLRIIKLDPQRTVENPRALLFRIAANLATDYQRRSMREAGYLAEDGLGIDVADQAPSIEVELFNKQQVQALKAAITELPPKCREVFILHKFDHLSYAEIARLLGIAESTVVKHMVKALAFCKRRVEGEPPRSD